MRNNLQSASIKQLKSEWHGGRSKRESIDTKIIRAAFYKLADGYVECWSRLNRQANTGATKVLPNGEKGSSKSVERIFKEEQAGFGHLL